MSRRFYWQRYYFIFLVSAAVIIAAAILFIYDKRRSSERENAANEYIDTEISRHPETVRKAPGEHFPGQQDRRDLAIHGNADRQISFASAPSASLAQQAIDQALSNNNEYAKDWKFKLANYCAAAGQPLESLEPRNQMTRKPWLLARMREFCKGYTLPNIENINSIENLMNLKEREYEGNVLDDLSDLNIDEQSGYITNAIVRARHPEQVSAISNLLVDFHRTEGFTPWDPLGDDHFDSGYFEAQQFALQYFVCVKFRSCGQGSIWFTEMCLYFEPCKRSWTFEDILVNSVTPVQYRMGMRILGRLFERLRKKQP